MEPIYTKDFPLPGINFIKIYEPELDGDNSYYPIDVDGKEFHLKMNDEGFWVADGLSEELSLHIGEIIEKHDL